MFKLKKYKNIVVIVSDLLIVFLSYLFSNLTTGTHRLLFNADMFGENLKSVTLLLIIFTFMMCGFDVYKSLWRYAQAREFTVCLLADLSGAFVYYLADKALIARINHPLAFYVLVGMYSTFGMFLLRICFRHLKSRIGKPKNQRALLVGAGSAGSELAIYTREYNKAGYSFVCAVDDDETKIGKRIHGIDIVGKINDIKDVCRKYKIELIVIAIPSAQTGRRKEIIGYCLETNCVVKALPSLEELDDLSAISLGKNVRNITPEELLGREPIKVASDKLLDFIEGKTVAITGGGGSIGSELCRQVVKHNPKELIIIDIYENNAYDIQQELLRAYGKELKLFVYIASVRDYNTINCIFEKHKPDLVIHAAAHKHVPLMETSPKEAVKNNVFGTKNVAEAAMANGVSKFLLISTDKAVNPTNIMGATKRICEKIIQSKNGKSKTQFLAVRFGNVLGSNGSVIPLFKRQIESGGPVTVTHPEIIRYFMTIPEAAQLVLTAGAMAKGGEIFVLDMGEPVKIDDLARNMIKLSGLVPGKDIEIRYTGLRPGEKLYEELLLSAEGTEKTENNKIFIGKQTEVDTEELDNKLEILKQIARDPESTNSQVEEAIKSIVPTFKRLVLVDGEHVYEDKINKKS